MFDHRGQDNCISPCATIPLTFGLPDTSPYSNGSFHQRVYFKKFIPVLKEVPKYPFESLVAEVGGYLGLLLGVSVLDFLKVPDHVWNFFRKWKKENMLKSIIVAKIIGMSTTYLSRTFCLFSRSPISCLSYSKNESMKSSSPNWRQRREVVISVLKLMEEEISQMSCELKLVCFNLPISAWEMRGQVKGSTMKKAAAVVEQTKRFEAMLKTVHNTQWAKLDLKN